MAAGNGGLITTAPINGINKDAFKPNSFELEQNYPNPFNPSTSINFTINEHRLLPYLFDILGREVKSIFKGEW